MNKTLGVIIFVVGIIMFVGGFCLLPFINITGIIMLVLCISNIMGIVFILAGIFIYGPQTNASNGQQTGP
jgi:hypothetical protein